MDKIYKLLGLDKIDESKQDEVKSAIDTMINTKALQLTEEKEEELISEYETKSTEYLDAEKAKLVESYETKFETYKDDITTKFSTFVDKILAEEIQIPAKVVEFARVGELYEDVITQFKTMLAVDEGVLDDEVKSLLKEAKEEIIALKGEVNESTKKLIDLEDSKNKIETEVHLRKKSDGLTEAQKKVIFKIFNGTTIEDIDEKFDIVLESMDIDVKIDEKEEEFEEKECPDCGAKVRMDKDGICPECKNEKKEKADESKGHVEVKKEDIINEVKEEKSTPFNQMMSKWKKSLTEGTL
jgi:hypothetical protein